MQISLSAIPSALTSPVLTRQVAVTGVEIDGIEAKSVDKNSRQMLRLEFDVAEMSFATFLKAREDGLPLIGLPIFTGRRFLQPCIAFSRRAGISALADLKGKRVGIPQYWMTSSVWHRDLLAGAGVQPQTVAWYTTTAERLTSLRLPAGVVVRQIDQDKQGLQEMLRAGEIDAILSPRPVSADADAGVSLPFANIAQVQRDYFQTTGILPIMHFVVMKQRLDEENPGLALQLCFAFKEAKETAVAGVDRGIPLKSPIHGETFAQSKPFFGGDPWPYGIKKNERALNRFLASAYEQALVSRLFRPEELFAASSLSFSG